MKKNYLIPQNRIIGLVDCGAIMVESLPGNPGLEETPTQPRSNGAPKIC